MDVRLSLLPCVVYRVCVVAAMKSGFITPINFNLLWVTCGSVFPTTMTAGSGGLKESRSVCFTKSYMLIVVCIPAVGPTGCWCNQPSLGKGLEHIPFTHERVLSLLCLRNLKFRLLSMVSPRARFPVGRGYTLRYWCFLFVCSTQSLLNLFILQFDLILYVFIVY